MNLTDSQHTYYLNLALLVIPTAIYTYLIPYVQDLNLHHTIRSLQDHSRI
jgi:hypothetical protein